MATASFFQWETAPLTIIIENDQGEPAQGVLEDVKNLVVSFRQGSVKEDWFLDDVSLDVENSAINIHFDQERSGKFDGDSTIKVQVNILYNNNERDATIKGKIDVLDNFYDKELV